MGSPEKQSQGVAGTINAFNFIRRIGFPPPTNIVSIFVTLAGLSGIVSLPMSGLTLASTIAVILSAIVLPTTLGEALCSKVALRGDPVLNFRRLMGMETLAWSPMVGILPLY